MIRNKKPIARRIIVCLSSVIFNSKKNILFYLIAIIITFISWHITRGRTKASNKIISNTHKIKLPILVVGMPKTGTTSIFEYFKCGKFSTSHYRCLKGQTCSKIISSNIKSNRPPFSNTRNQQDKDYFDVYTQMDGNCYFPQIESLDEIHKFYPEATFILNVRNATSWVRSVRNQKGCHVYPKCVKECLKGFTDEELVYNYTNHIKRVHKFVERYPSHKLVEIRLEDEHAGSVMEDNFGISAIKCWGKANVNNKYDKSSTT